MLKVLYPTTVATFYKTVLALPHSARHSVQEWEQLMLTLLSQTLNISKHTLPFAHQRTLSPFRHFQLYRNVHALKRGLPLGYILKQTPFCNLTFYTPRGVFLPRVETEELTYKLIDIIPPLLVATRSHEQPYSLLDIGTGTGVIAISLKKHFPKLDVTAIDSSAKAVNVARKNARTLLPATKIHIYKKTLFRTFLQKSLYDTTASLGKYDIVVSNPPYIGKEDPQLSPPVHRYEPHAALFSGQDGLNFFRNLANGLSKLLKKNGRFYCEFGYHQHYALKHIFKAYHNVKFHKDLFGKYRFMSGEYRGSSYSIPPTK